MTVARPALPELPGVCAKLPALVGAAFPAASTACGFDADRPLQPSAASKANRPTIRNAKDSSIGCMRLLANSSAVARVRVTAVAPAACRRVAVRPARRSKPRAWTPRRAPTGTRDRAVRVRGTCPANARFVGNTQQVHSNERTERVRDARCARFGAARTLLRAIANGRAPHTLAAADGGDERGRPPHDYAASRSAAVTVHDSRAEGVRPKRAWHVGCTGSSRHVDQLNRR